jgi:D-3-phosphoglycerate dehydrogenase
MAIRILTNDGIDDKGKKLLTEAGFDVDSTKYAQDKLADVINNYDVLTVRSATKVRKELLDVMQRTKLIVRGGVGLDNIDFHYAESKGIAVRNTPRASSQSVAELVFAHLFSIARMLHDANRTMPASGLNQFNDLKKKYANGWELRGKTLGLIGFGNIGRATARAALGLGMHVVAYDLFPNAAEIIIDLPNGESASIIIHPISKEEVLRKSDIISIHSAGDTEVIGTNEFSLMKKGSVLINCARGGTVNEAALLQALHSGQVAFAGIDVFEKEPTDNAELLHHPNVSLSPHIGASTLEAQERIGIEVYEIIRQFFPG